jgi:sulfonate transport system substrate-binding protein
MIRRQRNVLAAAALVLLAVPLIMLPRCAPHTHEQVTIATTYANLAGLIFVASSRDLYQKNGLSASISKYQSGPLGLRDLVSHQADIASAGDFAFVANSVKNLNLKVVGAIAKGGGMQIIARRDSGIVNAADLVGKKVAVPKGTVSEFFLVAYCQRNGVAYQRLNIIYLPHEEVVEAMKKGTVNAACVTSPFIDRIADYLGNDAIVLRSYGRTDYYGLVVTRDDVLRDKPDVITRLLKTMLDAEAFVRQHPDEAMQIIAKETGLTIDQVRRGWPENKYEVRLDQDLITLMEAEAQWMIRNNLTDTKVMPNFLDMIDLKPLKAVKPGAVGVIH